MKETSDILPQAVLFVQRFLYLSYKVGFKSSTLSTNSSADDEIIPYSIKSLMVSIGAVVPGYLSITSFIRNIQKNLEYRNCVSHKVGSLFANGRYHSSITE